ncbi:C40 family peptidase [Pseudaestuariivita rosea]|uniref:C40 family peptidase n=1 Tax=Pseudaestuariivita rosea TaxID=2763263 RepID=UPI001F1CA988|nr:NlpC/P60 family protein [Pseudaestuariivita rosea]
MDPRLTPANDRVAASFLQGQVQAERFVEGERRQVTQSFADLLRRPDGARDRQVLFGEDVQVFEQTGNYSFVQAAKDGYCGYVLSTALGEVPDATHIISARSTHLYQAPDFKSPDHIALSFGARVAVAHEEKKFFELTNGLWVPKPHLRPVDHPFQDPVTIAQLHFGSPYLWGGNTVWGLDCSALVQAALVACGVECPGDSDLQEQALGRDIPADAPLQRGDLLFWDGHVGFMVDADTLIHANVHHMAVAYEPVQPAIVRIEAQGDGPVTARKRLG